MSNYLEAPAEAGRQRLGKASTLARFALIGVALAAVAGTFAYFGGWFTPNELTPARLTDAFEQVDGSHPGFRRNHAKGVGVSGSFESNGTYIPHSDFAIATAFGGPHSREAHVPKMLPRSLFPERRKSITFSPLK
jgi:hypothetical protein